MYRIILLFCLCIGWQNAFAQQLDEYWTLDEYEELHPEQVTVGKSFNDLVHRDAVPIQKTQADPVKILVVYPGVQVSDYWRRSVASLQARMQELGIEYRLESYFTKAGIDLALQADLLEGSLQDEPDILIFTLDAKRHEKIIKRLLARGQTKIILQNITTPLKSFGSKQPFMYVGFDHLIGTKILVDKYRAEFPNGAKYAVLYGARGYVSQLRGGGFIAQMSQYDDMTLHGTYYTNFDRKRAKNAALDLLAETPDLDFIYASSTDVAHGVTDALIELELLDQVTVNGWGGGGTEIEAMAKGEIDFTVMRMNDDNGVAMAEAIKLLEEGREAEIPLVYSGEIKLLEQSTSAVDLDKMREFAFRYSDAFVE